MAQQIVNVGNVASDGTGDELRNAFTKVNANFTELYSGNIQVTAANVRVFSVAGRTGNVVLTVNDVSQAASKSYVDTSIASNIAVFSGYVINSLRANVEAANVAIGDAETRITSVEGGLASQAILISQLGSSKASISYVDSSIEVALSSNAQTANILVLQSGLVNTNSNVANLKTTVDSLSASNYVLLANSSAQESRLNTIDANVAAANIQLSQVKSTVIANDLDISLLASNAAVQAGQIASINSNLITTNSNLNSLVSNVGSISTQLTSLSANAAGQSIDIGLLNSNVASLMASATANAAAQSLEISSLWANAGSQANSLIALGSNAAVQGNLISQINVQIIALSSNDSVQAGQISALSSLTTDQGATLVGLSANAATQSLDIANLYSNVAVLTANATTQATQLSSLTANAAAQAVSINSLVTNAATQATQISSLSANNTSIVEQISTLNSNVSALSVKVEGQSSNVLSLQNTFGQLVANAALQSQYISATNANVVAANSRILTNANDISSLQLTAADHSVLLNTLVANAATQSTSIDDINANISTIYDSLVSTSESIVSNTNDINGLANTKASLSGDVFTGNIQAPYVSVTNEVLTTSLTVNTSMVAQSLSLSTNLSIGSSEISMADNPLAILSNVDGKLYTSIKNISSNATSSSGTIWMADDGTVNENNIEVAINSSAWMGNFIVPSGDTGIPTYAHDGHVTVIGGNVLVRSDNNAGLIANTSSVVLQKDSDLVLTNANLRFADGTVQSSAIQDVQGLYLSISTLTDDVTNTTTLLGNVGNLSYTPANAANWNGTITNIQQALDEIAQRLRDINA